MRGPLDRGVYRTARWQWSNFLEVPWVHDAKALCSIGSSRLEVFIVCKPLY
jgi:hypothetical protein